MAQQHERLRTDTIRTDKARDDNKASGTKRRERARKRLRGIVDRNTKAAERIHRAVAGFPLDVLEQIDGLEKPVARVRKLQDRSIRATYDLVRGIEQEVARLAGPRRTARTRTSRKPRSVKPTHASGRAGSEMAARAS